MTTYVSRGLAHHPKVVTWVLVAIAAAAGAMVAVSPLVAGGGIVGLTVIAGMLALGRRSAGVFLRAVVILLVGYALLNKGFAYLGVQPAYPSEIVLALTIPVILTNLRRSRIGVMHALLVAYMAWGFVRTVPYVSTYGIDALRDAVAWGYAPYAVALSLVVRRRHVRMAVAAYRRAVPFLVAWIPAAALIAYGLPALLPTIPGTDVPILVFKSGDAAVHLAGISAFILVGLYGHGSAIGVVGEALTWAAWAAGAAIISALNRGGMVAILTSAVALLFVRSSGRWVPIAVAGFALIGSMVLINPVIDVGTERKVSFTQFIDNVASIVTDTDDPNLEDSKSWRVAWWNHIVDYTVNGSYFWTGKGYGINLADADGFQVAADHSLRGPHNGHLVLLARSGVPGLALWLALQVGFAVTIVRAALRSRRVGRRFWTQVLAVVFVYWLAAMVNMSFDVYLEGPQGGIWFWSVIGFGLAAAHVAPRTRARVPAATAATEDDESAAGAVRPSTAVDGAATA
jgi:hypothetical protein